MSFIEQKGALTKMPLGRPGQIAKHKLNFVHDVLPVFITPGDEAYVISVDAAPVVTTTYTVTDDLSKLAFFFEAATVDPDDLATGLAGAWNGDAVLSEIGTAVAATNTVTITLDQGGNANLELSVSDAAVLSVALPADPAVANPIEPGKAIYRDPSTGTATHTRPAGAIDTVWRGVSLERRDLSADTIGGSEVTKSPRGARYAMSDYVFVEGGAAAVKGGVVYVGTASPATAETAQYFTEAGTDREALAIATAEWDGPYTIHSKRGH